MKKDIDCPYCRGIAHLKSTLKEITFKKEVYPVNQHFYQCDTCQEEFTTTGSDTLTLIQADNQYREKHSIPYPDEIRRIREGYNFSAAAMSEVLGLGANGYSNYERGEIPTSAIGNLIASASNPWVFKEMLLNAKGNISNSAYLKALSNVDKLIDQQSAPKPFYYKIDIQKKPSAWTGYRAPSVEKVKALFIKFLSSCNPVLNDRLKLNKLLFYTDFMHYKYYGFSVTGLSYRSIQFGPVPSCYDNLFALFESEEVIFPDWQPSDVSGPREIFFTQQLPDPDSLTKSETEVAEDLCRIFENTPSWDLVELSHKENAWVDLHHQKELISYQKYAFSLRGVD